ncbi:hypothetical protein NL64_17570 [Pseudomonas fluorescens]|nr:hypothetical protein NL64_17570 [Pseudomonas fluorescens]
MSVPVSYRGFVISSGFAWVQVSLPTTAHVKRGGTIPMGVPSVCTVVVHAVKRRSKDRSLRQLLHLNAAPVGAAAGCDLFAFKKKGLEIDLQALKR